MKSYILSIISAAIACGIAGALIKDKNTVGKIVKMLCGIMMAVTVLAPIKDISFQGIDQYFRSQSTDAHTYVQEGTEAAKESIANIIKSQTEAYILDKANTMGLQISVEVELDGQNNSVPCGVTITGKVSPYAKEIMGAYLETNLGIPKESQRWI